jgi:hypothetical protein
MAKTRGLIDALRGAAEETSKATAEAVQSMREHQQEIPNDYGEQIGLAIEKYGDNVADFLRSIGDQAAALGQSHCAQSHAVADNIVDIAKLEAERTKCYIHRMRELGRAMASARKNFEQAVGHPINNVEGPVDLDVKMLEGALKHKEEA